MQHDNSTTVNSAMSDALKSAQSRKQEAPQQPAQQQGYANPNHQQSYQQNPNQQQPQQRTMSTLRNRLTGHHMFKHSNAGERVRSMMANMTKIFQRPELNQHRDYFKLVLVDNQSSSLARSAVVVCAKTDTHVFAHPLIIAGSGDILVPRVLNHNIGKVENIITDGDVNDNNFWNGCRNAVHQSFRDVPVENIQEVAGSVIAETMNVDDLDEVAEVLSHACSAVETSIDIVTNNLDAMITGNDLLSQDTITAQLEYIPTQTKSVSGQDIRSDVRITTYGVPAGQQSNIHNQSFNLCTVDAFVNLVYAPTAAPVQQQTVYGQPLPTAPQLFFVPQMVITKIDTQFGMSLEAELLAISTAGLLGQQQAWVNVFKPRHDVAGIDPKDIGAVGLEVQLSPTNPDGTVPPLDRINTKEAAFGAQGHVEVMQATTRPEMVYSLDVDEAGSRTWLENVFVRAAYAGEDGDKANARIIQAADNLTNGKFTEHFKRFTAEHGGRVMAPEVNRIHLGHYTDTNGEQVDIRNIDYLAMLNFRGENNMDVVMDYSNTYDDLSIDEIIRMDRRAKIITSLNESARITGYARRPIFQKVFMNCLAAALTECGLVVKPEGVTFMTAGTTHGNTFLGNYAASSAPVAMFNSNYNQQPGVGQQMYGARTTSVY